MATELDLYIKLAQEALDRGETLRDPTEADWQGVRIVSYTTEYGYSGLEFWNRAVGYRTILKLERDGCIRHVMLDGKPSGPKYVEEFAKDRLLPSRLFEGLIFAQQKLDLLDPEKKRQYESYIARYTSITSDQMRKVENWYGLIHPPALFLLPLLEEAWLSNQFSRLPSPTLLSS